MDKYALPVFFFLFVTAAFWVGFASGKSYANDDWFRWVEDKIMPVVASCDLPAPTLPE